MVYKRLISALALFCCIMPMFAQPNVQNMVIDEVVAIVGDLYILRSDLEKEFETIKEQTNQTDLPDSFKVDILDQLIAKKLLVYKAQLDSVVIDDERVEGEMEQKLAYVLAHFNGDEKAFENYLGSSVAEFKNKTKPKIKEQMLMQEMQNSIIKDVKITPAEVRKFFKKIPEDSLPRIPAEIEVAKIVIKPKVSAEAKEYAKFEAEEIRKRLVAGDDFCFLARSYSQDPGSSGKCGELGFFKRGKMVPEFEAAAFKLQKDSFSKVIESEYGFHILQMIQRRGESVNVRHILISPELISDDRTRARFRLDSLKQLIASGKITFETAAKKFSEDEYTAGNGGKIVNPADGSTKMPISELDKDIYLSIKDLKPGEMSFIRVIKTPDGKESYVLYQLVSETQPHYLSLETDYLKIQAAALQEKKNEALDKWVEKSKKEYYIHIGDRFRQEPELQHWISYNNK